MAYIDTLVVQAKRIDNKLVIHVKTTRDRRQLAPVTNQKGSNAALSPNFDVGPQISSAASSAVQVQFKSSQSIVTSIT